MAAARPPRPPCCCRDALQQTGRARRAAISFPGLCPTQSSIPGAECTWRGRSAAWSRSTPMRPPPFTASTGTCAYQTDLENRRLQGGPADPGRPLHHLQRRPIRWARSPGKGLGRLSGLAGRLWSTAALGLPEAGAGHSIWTCIPNTSRRAARPAVRAGTRAVTGPPRGQSAAICSHCREAAHLRGGALGAGRCDPLLRRQRPLPDGTDPPGGAGRSGQLAAQSVPGKDSSDFDHRCRQKSGRYSILVTK